MTKLAVYLLFFVMVLFCGCEEGKHTPPPTERVALAVRFFDSMEKRDIRSAVNQGRTILAMDQSQDNVRSMINAIESDTPLRQAQKAIDRQRLNEALKVVNTAISDEKKYFQRTNIKNNDFEPNQSLQDAQVKIQQMRNARTLLNEMHKAGNSAAMESALKSARTGLTNIRTPELDAFMASYEKKLQKISEKEKQNTMAVRDAASEAAEKAKAEDARREAEHLRFLKQRENTGEIPFINETAPQQEDSK